MRIFEQYESNVRSYSRSFPTVFQRAKGSFMYDEQGKEYIDFFAGAGTINYGHNNPLVNEALVEYIKSDGIIHSLDAATTAKRELLEVFSTTILEPRHLDYKLQFTGPTGTNAVETALKLARMVKGRSNVIAFTNAFHGLTMGSMAITGNAFYRDESFINRTNVSFIPFDGYFGEGCDSAAYLRKFLEDGSSGVDTPAAIILETVQAEGGVNVASVEWLTEIERICREFDILLIIDDIQVGNGRTGKFFSFEHANLNPDIVTLSKSIGGGLPLSIVLMKPELDQWKPGEHTGTFRGNNLAFVAARAMLQYWQTDDLSQAIDYKANRLHEELNNIVVKYPELNAEIRGRGLIQGIKIPSQGFCRDLSAELFERGLIIELAGVKDDVLKFLPPLVIEEEVLVQGIRMVDDAIGSLLEKRADMLTGVTN